MLAELGAAVRTGVIHPRELVDEALRRIEALNPSVNAVVALDADGARRAADDHYRQGPLAGVPVLIKDLIKVKGMRTSNGSPWFHDAPVDDHDDAVVARLRDAGAIIVGKTSTPSFGHTAFTANSVFGVTRNPWNLERTPGGSSGGSTAALACAMVPLATTTDGGGSVRIPASFTGMVGYKPTTGAIGRSFGAPRWIAFSTHGATGRSVADVITEAEVIFGPTTGDPMSVPRHTALVKPMTPRRVLVCESLRDRTPTDPIIAAAFAEVPGVLAAAGYRVESLNSSPVADDAMMQWIVIGAADLAHSLEGFRDRWDECEPGLQQQLHFGTKVSAADYINAQRKRYEVCAQLDAALGNDTVLVTLTSHVESYPAEGPLPMVDIDGRPGSPLNTPVLNLTGHPGVSVPLGIDSHGVPFGLQIVAPRWLDGLALDVAQTWERVRPWSTVAPGYEPWPMPA